MRKPGGCGAFGNDTYSQLAIMVATGNQLHLWIFLYGYSASKRRNLKSVLASIGVSAVVAIHEVGMYSTSDKSTMYIYLYLMSTYRSFHLKVIFWQRVGKESKSLPTISDTVI